MVYMKKKTVLILILIFLIFFHYICPNKVYGAYTTKEVSVEEGDEFKEFSQIYDGKAILYTNNASNKKNITVCVNAGHGTSGGENKYTQCNPLGKPKIIAGSTAAGKTMAAAITSGMTFLDGTHEADVTLAEAIKVRDILLENGYNVLMIRESNDVQLDNIARTILANKYAQCHIAIHWNSTEDSEGAFYFTAPGNLDDPDDPNRWYKEMYPVSENWQKHEALGNSLISGLKDKENSIYGNGKMVTDLTQTSYSTIPSVDIELGDRASPHDDDKLQQLAEGLCVGINKFFNENPELVNSNKSQTSKKTKKDKKGLLDKFYHAVLEKIGDFIDFLKFIFGDIPQIIANLLVTVPDGTWKDFKITYKYEDLLAEGKNGNKNKYTNVKEGALSRPYSAQIDGDEHEFSRDTEIPVIPVDLYHFAFGKVKLLDANILKDKGSRMPIISFVATIIHVVIYLMAAFLLMNLIWHSINIVRSSINPKEKAKHKDGLKSFIKAAIMLVGSVLVMGLCIYMTNLLLPNFHTEYPDELPIRINVEGDTNYSFSTSIIGYLRYMSDLKNTDMILQKLLYSVFYAILAVANCILILVMIVRFMILMYLSVLGPIIAGMSSLENKKIINMTFKDWVISYLFWSALQIALAIPYRITLEMNFKK